ncbi:hypothetical protein Golob_027983 [Gossypium lobatum]|uniref:RNase H type-1 domain-containing protein n=1 Tax=Gossypium lobatum TaxID=34289 RepID=A0A7J8NHY6_9ROSI|nr:hypothetical protein [Gossypium lobatum]
MRIGKDSIFKIEVRAILEGLNLAWAFDFRQLELECDNALVVKTILAGGAGTIANLMAKSGSGNYDEAPILLRELLKIDLDSMIVTSN